MRPLLWLPILALAAGCWQPRYFEPRENLTGLSPEGRPAAVYEVDRDQEGVARGQVRVWSDGAAARYTEDDAEVVDLSVAIELENNGTETLEVDVEGLRIEELFLNGYLQPHLAPADVVGRSRAAPGETARLDLIFQPQATYPADIDSFHLRFAVRDDGGGVMEQVTPFLPALLRPLSGGAYWSDRYWGGAYWGAPPAGFYGAWGWSYGWPGVRCR